MNTALVTGSSTGVGFALTRRLLREGWRVITLDRSGHPVDDDVGLAAEREGRLQRCKVDLADLPALHTVLDTLLATGEAIDVVFNNAGVSTPVPTSSKQGRDLNFELNTVVPYVVATRLVPALQRGTDKTIINVSSNAQLYARGFDLDRLAVGVTPHRSLVGPYAHSKLALSLWTQAAADRFAADGIEIRSVCPGPNQTPMTAKMAWWTWPLRQLLFTSPTVGADRVYDAAFKHRGARGVWLNKGKPTPSPQAGLAPQVLALVDGIATASR